MGTPYPHGVSAEISTLVQPAALSLGTLTILRPAVSATVGAVVPTPAAPLQPTRTPSERTRLEPLVDAVLRLLWMLVGVYVWVVLLVKGPPSRSASRELEPLIWPQAEYPAEGLPALGLPSAGRIR